MFRPCAAALLLLISTAVPAQTGEARMQRFLDQVDSLSTDFSQALFDDRGSLMEESRGRMYLHRPDRFRWEYVAPYPQLIVGDGERVWLYDEDLEQVTVKRMSSAIGTTPALLLSSRRPVRDSFEVRELGERDGRVWVGLRPRGEHGTFDEIRLAFEGPELQVMELADNFGQTTVLTFSNLERNGELPASLFTFTPPDKVDVIDEGA